jgi:hypothetical protein
MEKKPNPNRGKTLNTHDAKRLVLILAVTSTLGFWVLFSNKARQDAANASVSNDQSVADTPPADSQNQLVLDLPPMPTLIPTLDPSTLPGLTVQTVPQQNNAAVSLPQPTLQPSVPTGKILLGGAAPGSTVSQPRKRSSSGGGGGAVTTTHSSRP